MQGSQSIFPGAGSSRPFLHVLNPMGKNYKGYVQANQSVLEEEEEENDDGDLEAGHASRSNTPHSSHKSRSHGKRRGAWGGEASELHVLRPNIRQADPQQDEFSSDEEVPQNLMIEAVSPGGRKSAVPALSSKGKEKDTRRRPLYSTSQRQTPPILPTTVKGTSVSTPPRPSEIDVEEAKGSEPLQGSHPKVMRGLDAHERALWNWVNVYNLDAFLQEAYYYYEGKGIYSIALSRGLNLLTVGFVIGFSTFLLGCVDYSLIRSNKATRLSDIIVDRCVSRFSGFTFLFFVLFTAFFVWQIVTFALSTLRLVDMYRFYTYLLHIPDADIQTISWPEVVRRIGAIREDNPLTALSSTGVGQSVNAKLDAHDIANRIMRQENYLIALFNKELLDLRVPLPPLFKRLFGTQEEGKGRVLTRALEWNLRFCLMEYLFDSSGKVRKVFLKSRNRAALIDGLRRRFIFMGILNAIFAPFIVLYLIMYSFFRYFEEYHKNPSSIGGRRYTPFAQWKFREFNELPHLFKRRLNESYPAASMYIGQFPNEKLTLIMRFAAFIAGSFAAVLILASVVDPELFLYFEITPNRTVVFYVTVFGAILAVARGMIPEENRVFDPELLMIEVIQDTHYMPDEWKGQLHSKKVHEEFGELFAMKVMIFAQELLSVILTPFVLWYSLPPCAPAIIDFFREFSVHVDGLGYVCSFAVFDFQRHGNVKFGAPTKAQDERLMSKQGKMEKSFLNFKAANPDWIPADPTGSLYLNRIADFSAAHPVGLGRRRLLRRPSDSGSARPVYGQESMLDTTSPQDAIDRDRTLRQSQTSAQGMRRRGSVLMQSTRGPFSGPTGVSTMFQSAMGAELAQTAILEDSQSSVMPAPPAAAAPSASMIPEEELAHDGGVGSMLGESYVDGRRPTASQAPAEEDEEPVDGGVLGLLAQIYGTGANVKGRGRGPPRAI
ncbi:APG9-domain-containing protein [Laetiporus sulphureus 93-53]|uniref:Autophagy-related protein 9 n=1 Tax=Laetiporus sulphureus 93-53 TaxID=1314785 RepID=A0A165FYG1_9APHY|nr:APG9-domain-containing protein [Laetiporus sulphureus 93-53]KZT09581.1 APG9-domain-containing protein [Laetiporus sulphureus 93-53]